MLAGTKYWDMFDQRIDETAASLKNGVNPPLRRIALHITNKCNMKCSYCNECHTPKTFRRDLFTKLVVEFYEMGGGILHITGGEPSCVSWLFEDIEKLEAVYGDRIEFNLNSNLLTKIPYGTLKAVNRLKVSLDSSDGEYFDSLVGIKGAFEKVCENLKYINDMPDADRPTTSITYTMTHENYTHIPDFLEMYHSEFPNLYAAFFSTYKGTNERFKFTDQDIDDIIHNIQPQIDAIFDKYGDTESKFLFHASHDATTFVEDVRFHDNKEIPCYLQLSELVINEDADLFNCSHLFRDGEAHSGLNLADGSLSDLFVQAKCECGLKVMSKKCLYGCNKKLVTFNKSVKEKLNESL